MEDNYLYGNIKTNSITDILLPLIQEKKTGILIFQHIDLKKRSILQKVKLFLSPPIRQRNNWKNDSYKMALLQMNSTRLTHKCLNKTKTPGAHTIFSSRQVC